MAIEATLNMKTPDFRVATRLMLNRHHNHEPVFLIRDASRAARAPFSSAMHFEAKKRAAFTDVGEACDAFRGAANDLPQYCAEKLRLSVRILE